MDEREEKTVSSAGRDLNNSLPRRAFTGKSAFYGFLTLLFVAFCVKSFIDTELSLDFLKHTAFVENEQTGLIERVKVWGPSENTQKIFGQIMRPDFSWPVVRRLLLDMWLTIEISLAGTILAVVLSLPLSFIGAHNLTKGTLPGRLLFTVTRFVMTVLRAFPPILLALLFVIIVGIGPFAGVLALALHSVGVRGRLFADSIESIDAGQVEAVQAVGAHPLQVIWFGVMPQVIPRFIADSLFRLDMNIRMSIVIGIVGAGGIGFILDQYIKNLKLSQASTAFIIILVVVAVLDWASTWFKTRFA